MKYYLVEHDQGGYCPEVIEEFTNKKKACKKCHELRKHKDFVNAMRRYEGSHERITDFYSVLTTDDFDDGREYDHIKAGSRIY